MELLEKQLLIDLKEALRKDFETLTSLEHIPDAQDICRLADPAFQHVFAYCERNQEVGQVLLSDNGDIKFAREIDIIATFEFTKRVKYLACKKKLEINDSVFAKAYVSQIVSLIENWLLVSDKVVPKRVRELIGKVQVTAPFVMLKEKGWS